jgi:hypothetical protein
MQEEDLFDAPIGETCSSASGVVFQRRCFMATTAAAFAAAGMPGLAHARSVEPRLERLDYDDFLKEVIPVARALVKDSSAIGQDRYLHTLAAHAVRLVDLAPPEMKDNPAGNAIGSHPGGDPFVVLHWRMSPGSVIGVHPHIYGNVVTLCLEGLVHVSNFEVVGQRDWDAKEGFTVRRTVSQWLTPGSVNLVNLERNYMHGFRATTLSRGLDITTRIRERRETPSLVLGEPVAASEPDVLRASWKGQTDVQELRKS